MQCDQWGEILPLATPDKEKALDLVCLAAEGVELDDLGGISQKIRRYGTAKARNREMAGFLVSQVPDALRARNHPYKALSQKLYDCASWMEWRHYPESGKTAVHRASLCKKTLLCPVCAIRRGAKNLAQYHEKALALSSGHDFYAMALTVKNGPDLFERYSHLKHSFKRLRERGKKGYGVFSTVAGAVWSVEFTHSQETGWHPHLHLLIALPKGSAPIRYGQGSQLAADWLAVTGDSFITHVGSNLADSGDLAGGLCEVLKYALKFGDLSLTDNLTAYEILKGKRLIQSSGCFFGLELPESDDLLDDSIDESYFTLFLRYTKSGYLFSELPSVSPLHRN
jgi:hypothetical protein